MVSNCPLPPQEVSTLNLSRHFAKKRQTMATVYDFKLNDKKGNEVSLSDYKGKVLLLNMTNSKHSTRRIALRDSKSSISPAISSAVKLPVRMRRFTNSAR